VEFEGLKPKCAQRGKGDGYIKARVSDSQYSSLAECKSLGGLCITNAGAYDGKVSTCVTKAIGKQSAQESLSMNDSVTRAVASNNDGLLCLSGEASSFGATYEKPTRVTCSIAKEAIHRVNDACDVAITNLVITARKVNCSNPEGDSSCESQKETLVSELNEYARTMNEAGRALASEYSDLNDQCAAKGEGINVKRRDAEKQLIDNSKSLETSLREMQTGN
jgi:hypothetical protein